LGIRRDRSQRFVQFVTDKTNEELSQALGLDAAGKKTYSMSYLAADDIGAMPHKRNDFARKFVKEYVPHEVKTALALDAEKQGFRDRFGRNRDWGYSQSIDTCKAWQVPFEKSIRCAVESEPVLESLLPEEPNIPVCSSSQVPCSSSSVQYYQP
jgi:hypothetical protein